MKVYSKAGLVAIGVVVIMVLSTGLSVVPEGMSAHGAAAPTAPSTSATSPTPASATSFAQIPAASGHTKGTVNVYEVAPQGANTMDPAVAYDTVSYEPILNVYQTLINYNGSSTDTFVPTLATCVPGTAQCTTDYGNDLIMNNATGAPTYWTFVIDPAAHFYDPTTKTSWPVYPTDVMFSLARTMGFADVPYAGKENGWIVGQALLPYGNAAWDKAIHAPYNNTPGEILGSMFINDSKYCPAAAMTNAHGCITFNASGGGSDWPYFLQLVADNLGSSVVPCGWFTAQSAGIPGWTGSKAAHGDGPCHVPQLGTAQSTTSVSWQDYLTNLTSPTNTVATTNMTSWDTFEELGNLFPANQPGVQWSMVGSGPYYAGVVEGIGYELRVNPGYEQPSGCSGVGGLAKYTGYCDPKVGGYIANINVYWEPNDQFGISEYRAGAADLAGIETVHTTTLLQLKAAGDLNYISFPTISSFFTPVNLYWSSSEYAADFSSEPVPTIPNDFFTNLALREFYVHAYPYTTVENTVNTVDGIQYEFNAGGPIPYGMGNYYPTNVSFPTGDPITNPSVVGGAAWWWAQANNVSSPYYDPQLSACSSAHPCTFPIAGLQGNPGGDEAIADWISEIESITGGALQPFGGSTFDLTFDQFLDIAFTSAYNNPLVSETGSGWAPDYPDPTDYIVPMATPDATYTAADAFSQQLAYGKDTSANNTTCGHNASTYANLVYWANAAQNLTGGQFNSTCQGVAYSVAVGQMAVAAGLPVGAPRTLDYNLIEQILNMLSMYVYDGQSNEVESAAPWINISSLNENPMIGGGSDQVFYELKYAYASTVTFQETGLAAGASWSVTLGPTTESSTSSTIAFTGIANGTYSYSVAFVNGYGAAPANGSVVVSGPITKNIAFTPFTGTTYGVTFDETGLVSNTTWGVIVNGVGTVGSNNPSQTVLLPNGAYVYAPTVIAGYSNSSAGTVTVASAAALVNITYATSTFRVFSVNFTASGLTSGKSWSATISSSTTGAYTVTSTASTISFNEYAGKYQAAFAGPSGYKPVTPTSSVTVSGNLTAVVPFEPSATSTAPSSSYLSPLAKEIIVALAVLAVLGFALAGWAAMRGPPSSPPPRNWSGDEKTDADAPKTGSEATTDSEFESEADKKS